MAFQIGNETGVFAKRAQYSGANMVIMRSSMSTAPDGGVSDSGGVEPGHL
jgi:hypothetical protein